MRKHYLRWTPEGAPAPHGLYLPSGSPGALPPVPMQFAHLVAWHTADSLVLGNVTTWYDLSGSGNHLVVKNGTPTIVDNAQNQHKALATVAGSSQWLQGPVVNWAQPNHYFLVVKQDADPTNSFIIDGTTNRNAIFMQGSSGFYVYYAGSSSVTTTAHDNTSVYQYHSVLFSGASSHYRIGGTTVATGNPGTAAMDQLRLSVDSSTAYYESNHYVELIVYNVALSTADEATVEAYLKAKYRL